MAIFHDFKQILAIFATKSGFFLSILAILRWRICPQREISVRRDGPVSAARVQ